MSTPETRPVSFHGFGIYVQQHSASKRDELKRASLDSTSQDVMRSLAAEWSGFDDVAKEP
jgi:hypothetical protein